jgi:LysM repeat protein
MMVILSLWLPACQSASQDPMELTNIVVHQVLPTMSVIENETYEISNCAGSFDIVESLGSVASIRKKTTVGLIANPGTDRGFEIPLDALFRLQDEVEADYDDVIQVEQNRIDQDQMVVSTGSKMIYQIEWEEQKYRSDLSFDFETKEGNEVGYEFILVVPKISTSQKIICGAAVFPTPPPELEQPTPTNPATPDVKPTVTATGQVPLHSNGSCESEEPPCTYTIQSGDAFSRISKKMYGGERFTPVLLHYNRDPNGYRRQLVIGRTLFIPALTNLPENLYPDCSQKVFPCLYEVDREDTFESIAEEFYGDPGQGRIIEHSNWGYDRAAGELTLVQLEDGIEVVLPVVIEE